MLTRVWWCFYVLGSLQPTLPYGCPLSLHVSLGICGRTCSCMIMDSCWHMEIHL